MSDINVTVQDEIVNIDVIDEPVLVNVVNSPGQQGPAGPGVPVGGTAGQILAKASATDYDTEWINNYAKYLATNVRNQTGSTIAAFQVVYISGATGNKPLVSLADADTEATSSKTYGVTATSIANNGTGDVVTAGELSGINTSAFNEGDLLWLSTTAGGVVTTPPAEPAHAVFIGYVVRSHPTLGTIDVSIQNGYELNELHGVQITTPTDNQGLFYNSTSTLWENKSITTALGYTPVPTTRNITINGVTYDLSADRTWTISTGISGSGASGQVTYWTGASAVSGSNNLFWDNAQGRLGIGTNAPTESMQVVGGNLLVDNNRGYRTKNTGGSTLDVLKADTSNNLLLGSLFFGGGFYLYTNTSFRWFQYPSSVATERMQLSTSGNLLIGSTSDNGQRLQVYGDTLLRGSGNTSATTALTVQNSDGTNMWRFANDGRITIGTSSSIIYPAENINQSGALSISGTGLQFAFSKSTQEGYGLYIRSTAAAQRTNTTGDAGIIDMFHGFAPTSGNGTYHMIKVTGTINQTGGANGITRGLYVNPTLTAAADWRSIEWSNNSGWGLYGAGTAANYLAGNLGIGALGLAETTFFLSKNITGGTTAWAMRSQGTIQSDVTSGRYFVTLASTQAAVFTVSTIFHYLASATTFGAGSTVTEQYGFHAASQLTGATNNYGFYGNIASGTGRWNLYMNGTADNYLAGNLGIGITPTVRLHVSGDTILKGSGATSSTTALTVQNSDGANLIRYYNGGLIEIGNAGSGAATRIYPYTTTFGVPDLTGRNLQFLSYATTQSATSGAFYFTGLNFSQTSGNQIFVNISNGFAPTSGTGTLALLAIQATINQTGGANGITRGLYVNPTLTSAADFRAIETARGNIVFSNLPTSSAGLPTGALWNDAGTVKIV